MLFECRKVFLSRVEKDLTGDVLRSLPGSTLVFCGLLSREERERAETEREARTLFELCESGELPLEDIVRLRAPRVRYITHGRAGLRGGLTGRESARGRILV